MRIHFIGNMGSSIKRLEEICKFLDYSVTGSDALGSGGHNALNVVGADLVVYSSAIKPHNVELAHAKNLGIKTQERNEFLGELSRRFEKVIAVSGTHGKTTVSSMMAEIFSCRDTCVHIGGDYNQQNGNGEFFLTEACEYKRSFLSLNPALTVVLNMDLDHTDCYKDLSDYASAFKQLATQSKQVLVLGDDETMFEWDSLNNYISFGFNPKNDYSAQNISYLKNGLEFDFYAGDTFLTRIKLSVHGAYNVLNALAASASAHLMGLTLIEIRDGLARYKGVKRRFELLAEVEGASIYTDYAHHPTEIKASISAAKKIGFKKIVVAFEPHTYTRTASLYSEFAESLLLADEVYLMPIFAAREEPIDGITSNLIYKSIKEKLKPKSYCSRVEICNKTFKRVTDFRKCKYKKQLDDSKSLNSYSELFDVFNQRLHSDTAIIFMGAGTIDNRAREFVASVKSVK